MGSNFVFQAIGSFLSFGVHVAIAIALIVVAATTVARHRPDASRGFLLAGIIDLVWTLVHWALVTIGPRLFVGSYEALPTFYGALGVCGSFVNASAGALLVVAVARVARPAPPVIIPPTPPYR